MTFKSQLDSTRFFYVQEGLAVGVLGSIAKTLFPSFPLLELFGYVGPIVAIAFGIKSWGDIKTIEAKNKNGGSEKIEIPIR